MSLHKLSNIIESLEVEPGFEARQSGSRVHIVKPPGFSAHWAEICNYKYETSLAQIKNTGIAPTPTVLKL